MLDWALQRSPMRASRDICFIGGYQIEKVRADYPHFTFRHNADWEHNNILASLMHAEDLMDEPFVCCYSDILFTADVVARRARQPRRHRAERRYALARPLPAPHAAPARRRGEGDGRATAASRACIAASTPDEAHGEYTGIAKFTPAGCRAAARALSPLPRRIYAGKPFREATVFEKAYLILLFQEMIEAGVPMAHVDTPGDYMEVDTQEDFELARRHWQAEVSMTRILFPASVVGSLPRPDFVLDLINDRPPLSREALRDTRWRRPCATPSPCRSTPGWMSSPTASGGASPTSASSRNSRTASSSAPRPTAARGPLSWTSSRRRQPGFIAREVTFLKAITKPPDQGDAALARAARRAHVGRREVRQGLSEARRLRARLRADPAPRTGTRARCRRRHRADR